jgi:hypothetical protein
MNLNWSWLDEGVDAGRDEANHFISEHQSGFTMNDDSFSSQLLDVVCSIPSPDAQLMVVTAAAATNDDIQDLPQSVGLTEEHSHRSFTLHRYQLTASCHTGRR